MDENWREKETGAETKRRTGGASAGAARSSQRWGWGLSAADFMFSRLTETRQRGAAADTLLAAAGELWMAEAMRGQCAIARQHARPAKCLAAIAESVTGKVS